MFKVENSELLYIIIYYKVRVCARVREQGVGCKV